MISGNLPGYNKALLEGGRICITFQATLAQRARWHKQAMEEECGTLERWIEETLDNYTTDLDAEREAIQDESP